MQTMYKYALAVLIFFITFIILIMVFGRTTGIGIIMTKMFGNAICAVKINLVVGGNAIPGGFFGC